MLQYMDSALDGGEGAIEMVNGDLGMGKEKRGGRYGVDLVWVLFGRGKKGCGDRCLVLLERGSVGLHVGGRDLCV